MNRDPAIERQIAVNELTEILCGKPCDICKFYGQRSKCMPVYTAEKIVDAGWRKASEVAREIFGEIDKILVRPEAPTALFYHCSKHNYNELEKKYMEEGK